MSEPVVIRGTVLPDGTLQLAGPLHVSPGPVEVEVRPILAQIPGEDVVQVLARIHADQATRGHVPRSAEEIDAELRESQAQWEEHFARAEAIQEAARQARESHPGAAQ